MFVILPLIFTFLGLLFVIIFSVLEQKNLNIFLNFPFAKLDGSDNAKNRKNFGIILIAIFLGFLITKIVFFIQYIRNINNQLKFVDD